MNTAYPLTIYYDASCALCNSEMQNILRRDTHNRLRLIDCSAPEFDVSPYASAGISREAMLNCLHAQDHQGNWLRGVEAFEVIYRSVGMHTIARLWSHPLTRPLAERIYPWVVRHRQRLSALGLHKLFGLWSQHADQATDPDNKVCKNGQCSTRQG